MAIGTSTSSQARAGASRHPAPSGAPRARRSWASASASSSHAAPSAPSAARCQRASRLPGQRGPGAGQAGHGEQRGERGRRPQRAGAAQQERGRDDGGGEQHGDAGGSPAAAAQAISAGGDGEPAEPRKQGHGERRDGGPGGRAGRAVPGPSQASAAPVRAPAASPAAARSPSRTGRRGRASASGSSGLPAIVPGSSPARGIAWRQRRAQVGDRPARLGAREDGAVDRGAQVERQVAPQAPERGQPRADPPGRRRGAAAAHRVDAGERLVEDERQRVEVGLGARRAALGLLGRHVGQRADDVARARQDVVAGDPRDAEVGQLGQPVAVAAAVGDDHVAGLDVAVHDPAPVRVGERVAQRDADAQDVAVRQGAVGHEVAERAPADELGDEVDGVVVAARLVERDDPGVRQARGGLGLALGARADRGVVDGDALDRDGALEALVVREPDDAEAARPQPAHEPVAAEDELAVAIARARGRRDVLVRVIAGGPHRLPRSPPKPCRPPVTPNLHRA